MCLSQGSQSEAAELLAEDRCEGMEYEDFRTDFPGMHEAIQDAVTGAVQDVSGPSPSQEALQLCEGCFAGSELRSCVSI